MNGIRARAHQSSSSLSSSIPDNGRLAKFFYRESGIEVLVFSAEKGSEYELDDEDDCFKGRAKLKACPEQAIGKLEQSRTSTTTSTRRIRR